MQDLSEKSKNPQSGHPSSDRVKIKFAGAELEGSGRNGILAVLVALAVVAGMVTLGVAL